MEQNTVSEGSPKKLRLQILAICLILSQSIYGGQFCGVQFGVGRAFTKGALKLKVMIFNLKDDFIREAAQERGDEKQLIASDRKFRFKSTAQLDWQREIIRENDPDIFIGSEIHKDEDAKLLMKLDTEGLKDKYWMFLKEGNSDRGINITIGVKKDLGFKFKLISYKHLRWTDHKTKIEYPLFARDLPTLLLTRPGEDKPSLIVIGNHAKSKRDNPGDPESVRYRTAQYEGVAKIVAELKAKYGEDIPIIMGGDFNTDVIKAAEMNPIRNILKSVFDSIPGKTFSYFERVTHFFFGQNETKAQPMDDIRVSGRLKVFLAKVLKYKKANGEEIPDPRSYDEREKLPSDHRPVIAEVELNLPQPPDAPAVEVPSKP